VIDVLAPDLPTLLNKIDGRVTIPNHYKLQTANAQITYASPGFFTRFLNVLIDPNLITLLFLAGLAGIGYEVFHPGVVLPGALGAAWLFAMTKAIQVRRSPVSVGPQTIVGEIGEFRGDGQVFVRGELWRAKAPEGLALRRGQKVRIDNVEPGLVLDVEPLDQAEQAT